MNSIDWLIKELAENGFLNITCGQNEIEQKRIKLLEIIEQAKNYDTN